MAVTRLTTNGLTGTKYDIASADNYYMEPIATQLLASTASSVTFSNIPQGYKHLQIRLIAASTRSDAAYADLSLYVNNNTGSNYSYHTLMGDPRPYFSTDTGASQTFIYLGGVLTGTGYSGLSTSYVGASIIDILDYSSTLKNKTIRAISGSDRNGIGNSGISANVGMSSGAWYNQAPISSITLTTPASFTANSRFSLYGIKG
jgi:hypothetical protein